MRTIYILFIICMALTGCLSDHGGSDADTNGNGGISGTGGPALPPPESIGVIDLPNSQFAQKRFKGLKLTSHYDRANVIYQIMNVRIFNDMQLQSKLFSSVYALDSTKDSSDTYHWQFTDTGLAEIKSVDFQGKTTPTQVEWLMKIIDLNSIEDSLLEGASVFDNTSGTWTILKTKSEKIIQIDWKVVQGVVTVVYTNISNNENKGDTITLEIKDKDVKMKYYDFTTKKTVEIKWNTASSAGSVLDPDFIDGQERFWNSNLENINDTDNF